MFAMMQRWFKSIIDVRKEEVVDTVFMVLYIYLILVTYYLLKPARDSLFLSNTGPEFLPLVFVLIAIVVVPVTTLYSRMSKSLKLNQLINTTTIVIIANLFILRYLLTFQGQDWVFYVFYIWVSIYGALTTSQFWLFANAIYDSAQAKRIFVIFSLAAILGAFSGGLVTSYIVTTFGVSTEDLLYFCVAFLAICIPLVNLLWRRNRAIAESQPRAKGKKKKKVDDDSWATMFRDIKGSRHLMLIMGIIAMTMATASFVDYQFKFVSTDAFSTYKLDDGVVNGLAEAGVASTILDKLGSISDQQYESKEAFSAAVVGLLSSTESSEHKAAIIKAATTTDKASLTAFLGQFYGGLSLLGFIFQLLFSYRALKIFGVGGVILFLPLSQIVASIGMLIAPNLTTAVMLRGSDGVFKYSIDKTARELLFLPIPLDVKTRSKAFIDLFIDRVFRGISGLVLLFLTLQLELSMRQLSMVVIGMVTLWIVLDLMIRKEYVNAFRKALDKGHIDPNELTVRIDDASTLQHLMGSLGSDNDRQVLYALNALQDAQSPQLSAPLLKLTESPNADIRARVVRILRNQHPDLRKSLEPLLDDPSSEVRKETCQYLFEKGEKQASFLTELLGSDDFLKRSAAVQAIAEYGEEKEKSLIDEVAIGQLIEMSGPEAEDSRTLAATSLGYLDSSRFQQQLSDLMNDESDKVSHAAIASAGRSGDRTFVPQLLTLFTERRHRAQVRPALAAYGEGILGTLNDYLSDSKTAFSVRKNIPGVMSKIPSAETVRLLIENLKTAAPGLRQAIIRALNALRNNYPKLEFPKDDIAAAISKEASSYYTAYQIAEKLQDGNERRQFLQKAVDEKIFKSRERIFRLLALLYAPQDIYNAYQSFISGDRNLVANASEFLENEVDRDIRKNILPIIEGTDIVDRAKRLFNVNIPSEEAGVINLLQGDDPWLAACAIFENADNPSENILAEIRKLDNAKDALIRETAKLVLDHS